MANIDRPRGFRPQERPIRESAYVAAGTIYPGDAVKLDNTGQVVVASAGATPLLGIAASKAVSGGSVMVWDHPEQKFVVQSDDGTTLAQTAIGLNYDIVATAGDANYNQSRMEMLANSGATNSNLPLRLLGVSGEVGTAIGEFSQCVVQINNHQLAPNTVGL